MQEFQVMVPSGAGKRRQMGQNQLSIFGRIQAVLADLGSGVAAGVLTEIVNP